MRVGALAWNGDQLSSGSRDRIILQVRYSSCSKHIFYLLIQRDIRGQGERKLMGHRQEICGLKWSPDGQLLASGGNDNKLIVWNKNERTTPYQTYADHVAAVKAIAWSPHQELL